MAVASALLTPTAAQGAEPVTASRPFLIRLSDGEQKVIARNGPVKLLATCDRTSTPQKVAIEYRTTDLRTVADGFNNYSGGNSGFVPVSAAVGDKVMVSNSDTDPAGGSVRHVIDQGFILSGTGRGLAINAETAILGLDYLGADCVAGGIVSAIGGWAPAGDRFQRRFFVTLQEGGRKKIATNGPVRLDASCVNRDDASRETRIVYSTTDLRTTASSSYPGPGGGPGFVPISLPEDIRVLMRHITSADAVIDGLTSVNNNIDRGWVLSGGPKVRGLLVDAETTMLGTDYLGGECVVMGIVSELQPTNGRIVFRRFKPGQQRVGIDKPFLYRLSEGESKVIARHGPVSTHAQCVAHASTPGFRSARVVARTSDLKTVMDGTASDYFGDGSAAPGFVPIALSDDARQLLRLGAAGTTVRNNIDSGFVIAGNGHGLAMDAERSILGLNFLGADCVVGGFVNRVGRLKR